MCTGERCASLRVDSKHLSLDKARTTALLGTCPRRTGFHTPRFSVTVSKYSAVADSSGELGREKKRSYCICVSLDFSGKPLHGAGDPRVAGSHRPSHQGSDASNNLYRGAQVQRGQGGSRKHEADLWHG